MALFVFGLAEGGVEKRTERERRKFSDIRKRLRGKMRLKEMEKVMEADRETGSLKGLGWRKVKNEKWRKADREMGRHSFFF